MLGSIGDILINGGIQLLGNTVKGTTELGLRKLGDFVKDKTGVDLFNGDILNNGLNSEQILALRKLEAEHSAKILEFNVEYARISSSDVSSARDMQKVTIQSDVSWFAKHFIFILALLLVLPYVFMQIYTATNGIPSENIRMVENMQVQFNNTVSIILGYFFGNKYGPSTPSSNTTYVPTVDIKR